MRVLWSWCTLLSMLAMWRGKGVGCVIFDEFHERGVDADTLLCLCREIQGVVRPELRLCVMSATLSSDLCARLERDMGARAVTSEGRAFPVTTHYVGEGPLGQLLTQRRDELVESVANTVLRALREEAEGDVLVFLPGEAEIRGVVSELEAQGLAPLPSASATAGSEVELGEKAEGARAVHRGTTFVGGLYGAMSFEDQQRILGPLHRTTATAGGELRAQWPPAKLRRVIVSSPIAESSLTIEGVRVVVDSGLRRRPIYNPTTGLEALSLDLVSKASATQRAGRAGRTTDGVCYRLWREHEHGKLVDHTAPEICSADLMRLALYLAAAWGAGSVQDMLTLPWIDRPPEGALDAAVAFLSRSGALENDNTRATKGDRKFRITDHGAALAKLNVHPRLGTMLLRAASLGDDAVLQRACALAGVLDEGDLASSLGRRLGPDVRKQASLVAALAYCAVREDDGCGRSAGSFDAARGDVTAHRLPRSLQRGIQRAASTAQSLHRSVKDLVAATSTVPLLPVRGCFDVDMEVDDMDGALLACAFPDRVARRRPQAVNRYTMSNGVGAQFRREFDRTGVFQSEYVVVVEHSGGGNRASRTIQLAAPTSKRAIVGILGGATEGGHHHHHHRHQCLTRETSVFVTPGDGSVRRRRVLRLFGLELESETLPLTDQDDVAGMLLDAVRSDFRGAIGAHNADRVVSMLCMCWCVYFSPHFAQDATHACSSRSLARFPLSVPPPIPPRTSFDIA